jgi:F-type H+-transporting ATPase subunit gamma
MLSTRDVKRKIRTVRNIEQICRAMKTVASIKLRRADARIRAARPYADRMAGILACLGALELDHPLLQQRPLHVTGVIVISGDRGLCGSYNASILRHAQAAAARAEHVEFISLGRKVSDFLRRTGLPVRERISPVGDEVEFGQLAQVADLATELYADGEWDAVDLAYTRFARGQHSPVVQERLLPLSAPQGPPRQFIYEPSAPALLEELLPRFIRTRVWAAALDAKAAEHAARVAAMTLATDNAGDMIQALTQEYNKARQATITRELLDIVGTAEALA